MLPVLFAEILLRCCVHSFSVCQFTIVLKHVVSWGRVVVDGSLKILPTSEWFQRGRRGSKSMVAIRLSMDRVRPVNSSSILHPLSPNGDLQSRRRPFR